MDAAAVLLIELEGLRETVEEQVDQIREVCQGCRAREFRVAKTAEERELLWKGRKNAFGAVGRVSAGARCRKVCNSRSARFAAHTSDGKSSMTQ